MLCAWWIFHHYYYFIQVLAFKNTFDVQILFLSSSNVYHSARLPVTGKQVA